LYAPVLVIAFLLWFFTRKKELILPLGPARAETANRWFLITSLMIVMIIIITIISISIHGEMAGAHERF
jgi:hypothetical protein